MQTEGLDGGNVVAETGDVNGCKVVGRNHYACFLGQQELNQFDIVVVGSPMECCLSGDRIDPVDICSALDKNCSCFTALLLCQSQLALDAFLPVVAFVTRHEKWRFLSVNTLIIDANIFANLFPFGDDPAYNRRVSVHCCLL